MSSVQPKVTGTLAKTPLLHVLTSLLEQGLTGTLVMESSDASRIALVVERGVPTKMRLGDAKLRLSDVLIDLGWVKSDQAARSYDKAVALGQLHGQVLVADGHIDQGLLECALRTQLVKKLQWAAALPTDTVFGFYEAVDYLSKWRGGATPVGPLVAIWVLARSRADPAVVATVISRIGAHVLRLHPKAMPRAFGFDRTEATLLDVLRARPQKLEALVRLGLVSPHTLERMLYALTLTRHLDFGRGLSPLGIDAVSEREEVLLLPKESLRPSRPVVLAATTSPADSLHIGLEDSNPIEPLTANAANAPTVAALDAIGIGRPEAAPNRPVLAGEERPKATPSAPGPRSMTPGATMQAAAPFVPAAARIPTPIPVPIQNAIDARIHDRRGGNERRSSSAPPHPQSGVPQRIAVTPSATQIERRAQIEKLALNSVRLNHFEMLGLPRDATTATVQDTYLKLAKAYHPDRLPPELADLKPLTTKIFARMSEAHQTLSDAAKRTAYLEQLDRGTPDDEEEKVRKVLHAAGAFQKAEVLLKKRMLAAAELEANRALEEDPEQADYLALYAWIQASKPDSESRLPELVKLLTEAIGRNPNSEKNRFYRVQIYKRLGQIDKAVSDCRIIVEKNPHHVDALREIRLWEMRRSAQKQHPAATPGRGATLPVRGPGTRSDPPNPSPSGAKRSDPPNTSGGLLGRLFKR